MEYARLGNSELAVSRLTFGGETISGNDWGVVDKRESIAAVHRAFDLGVNTFDTAAIYGLGAGEEILAEALGQYRHEVPIITKVGMKWRKSSRNHRAEVTIDLGPKELSRSIEGSLKRLRIEAIPLVLTHWPDPNVPISSTMEALAVLMNSGKVLNVGMANASLDQLRIAQKILPLACLEVRYNLRHRHFTADTANFCRVNGIGLLGYGPLAQGLLTGKFGRNPKFPKTDRRSRLPYFKGQELALFLDLVEAMKEVAENYSRSVAQVALRWSLDSADINSAIVGIRSPKQMEENSGAVGWKLDDSSLRFLESKAFPIIRSAPQLGG